MIDLKLNLKNGRAPRFMFIGAHCDDIEIGCGGTVLELLARYPSAAIDWIVMSSGGKRTAEAKKAAKLLLADAHKPFIEIKSFRTSFFPMQAAKIKSYFEELKQRPTPDVVFVHYRSDLHQDHRVLGELAWNTFRDHVILEYEIPKYDGGLGSPNVFMPVRKAFLMKKLDILMQVFGTQRSKRWFSEETFAGLMRLRGVECNAEDGYAEAFYGRKLVL